MNDRIQTVFAKTRQENRAALITFVMGYDPDAATSLSVLKAMPAAGADIIEIGMPFSDPMADGPVIQAAGLRALKAGATMKNTLTLVADFRKSNNETPLILMGYYNPIYRYGAAKFCTDAAAAGADGLILVDLPPEEEQELRPYLDETGLKLIRLIAPTSGEDRIAALTQSATGFVYYISITGITGAKTADSASLAEKIGVLRQSTSLPIAAGFGIKTSEHVKNAAASADAVVVGSALVDAIAKDVGNAAAVATRFVSDLAKGLKKSA